MESFAQKRRRIDLMQDRAKKVRMLPDFFGKLVENRRDRLLRCPFHDNDQIIFVAEILDIIDPKFIELALLIDQIEPGGLHFKVGKGEKEGEKRQHHRKGKRLDRIADRQTGERQNRRGQNRRFLLLVLRRSFHQNPSTSLKGTVMLPLDIRTPKLWGISRKFRK